ncbi:MAG: Transcriptional regulator, AraC family [Ktedonobacterales bacterium]|jgi:AraC-like DNA-binding protein|nr:MAG: Transcriptional regulator, AraC family [Ktedonobacterales bacterium]
MAQRLALETATFWRDPALHNLELLRATYVTHVYAPHMHEGFAIGVIERGVERFSYRRAIHDAPAGAVVLINPGEPHTGAAALPEGWTYRMLYPAAETLRQIASAVTGRPRDVPFFAEPVITDPALALSLLRLHATLEAQPTPVERESQLLMTLGHLIVRHADSHPHLAHLRPAPEAVRRVREYLAEHYAEAVTLRELASLADLSPFHLLRVFSATAGLPPHAYLTQVRVSRAKGLLVAGMPLAQVAALTGFTDQSHFTRHFKRIVGVPPGHYARAAS